MDLNKKEKLAMMSMMGYSKNEWRCYFHMDLKEKSCNIRREAPCGVIRRMERIYCFPVNSSFIYY
jgi:hypothetical protein